MLQKLSLLEQMSTCWYQQAGKKEFFKESLFLQMNTLGTLPGSSAKHTGPSVKIWFHKMVQHEHNNHIASYTARYLTESVCLLLLCL